MPINYCNTNRNQDYRRHSEDISSNSKSSWDYISTKLESNAGQQATIVDSAKMVDPSINHMRRREIGRAFCLVNREKRNSFVHFTPIHKLKASKKDFPMKNISHNGQQDGPFKNVDIGFPSPPMLQRQTRSELVNISSMALARKASSSIELFNDVKDVCAIGANKESGHCEIFEERTLDLEHSITDASRSNSGKHAKPLFPKASHETCNSTVIESKSDVHALSGKFVDPGSQSEEKSNHGCHCCSNNSNYPKYLEQVCCLPVEIDHIRVDDDCNETIRQNRFTPITDLARSPTLSIESTPSQQSSISQFSLNGTHSHSWDENHNSLSIKTKTRNESWEAYRSWVSRSDLEGLIQGRDLLSRLASILSGCDLSEKEIQGGIHLELAFLYRDSIIELSTQLLEDSEGAQSENNEKQLDVIFGLGIVAFYKVV